MCASCEKKEKKLHLISSSKTARYGKIAGGNFSQLELMYQKFESKVNTEGLPGTFWGYGESEDDTTYPTYAIDGKRAPKPVRRGNWNFNRATTPPSAAVQRKTWQNCDYVEETSIH